jgi:hypothetical protein
MAAVAPALTAVSSAASLAGTFMGAAGQREAGAEQAQAYATNAEIQRRNAQMRLAQAYGQAAIDVTDTERAMGGITAAYGASGVSATTGSPLEVMHGQMVQGELTRQLDIYRGVVAATSAEQEATLQDLQAQAAVRAGQRAATGTLLTGIAGAARGAMPLIGSFGGSGPAATSDLGVFPGGGTAF